MTLRELPTSVMIVVCEYFLENCKAILAQHPLLSVLPPFVQETLDSLLKSTATLPGNESELLPLQEAARSFDTNHDTLNRVLYAMLSALVDYTKDVSKQQTLLTLRDTIFPHGLRINRFSWPAEAGESGRLRTQLEDASIQKQLSDIRLVHEGQEIDGLTLARGVVSAGQGLGECLRRISHAQFGTTTPSSNAQTTLSELDARRKFLQLVRILRESSQIALEKQPEQYEQLWRVLDKELSRPSPSRKSDVVLTQDDGSAPPDALPSNPTLPVTPGGVSVTFNLPAAQNPTILPPASTTVSGDPKPQS